MPIIKFFVTTYETSVYDMYATNIQGCRCWGNQTVNLPSLVCYTATILYVE